MSETLDHFMCDLAERAVQEESLDALSNGSASLEMWAVYVRERLRTIDAQGVERGSSIFETFLEAAMNCAREQGHEILALAFEKNLKEERGIDKGGRAVEEEAHQFWRKCFRERMVEVLTAQTVAEEMFSEAPTPQTLGYTALLKDFIDELGRGELFEAAGALCVLERIIKNEYQKISQGLNHNFPMFDAQDRRYIDDHAEHDESHYQWIRAALDRILSSTPPGQKDSILAEIQKGAERMAAAKRSFFAGLY